MLFTASRPAWKKSEPVLDSFCLNDLKGLLVSIDHRLMILSKVVSTTQQMLWKSISSFFFCSDCQ